MKLLKILIYKFLIIFFFLMQLSLSAQDFSAQIGIYDFTNETAREFYLLAPTVFVGYDCYMISRLRFNASTGFSYRSFKYNTKRHHLYMIPIFLSIKYDLPNPEAKVYPYIGGGLSLLGKADKNVSLSKTHYAVTYGYHITGGLCIYLSKKISLTLDIRYNFLVSPAMEEINLSGIVSGVGVKIPILRDNDRDTSK